MNFIFHIFLNFLCLSSLGADQIVTFYGPIEVEEPVLLELIKHPMFQRLKYIHQYGIAYYTTHHEEYSRYDHSLGVFALLRSTNASLEEQIAGLLHDASHTVFSHVGDWIFGREYQERDYQSAIHTYFIEKSGLGEILSKYGYTAQQILPDGKLFPALERKGPDLCADRIDYNIQGAFYQGFITQDEAIDLFQSLKFVDNHWQTSKLDLLKKLVRFSVFMTINCWGDARNYMMSRWLSNALLQAVKIDLITMDDIHFGTDDIIWIKLTESSDPLIKAQFKKIANPNAYFKETTQEKGDFTIFSKFRGLDPLVQYEGHLVRLTSTDPILLEEYNSAKEKVLDGWPVIIYSDVAKELSPASQP